LILFINKTFQIRRRYKCDLKK